MNHLRFVIIIMIFSAARAFAIEEDIRDNLTQVQENCNCSRPYKAPGSVLGAWAHRLPLPDPVPTARNRPAVRPTYVLPAAVAAAQAAPTEVAAMPRPFVQSALPPP